MKWKLQEQIDTASSNVRIYGNDINSSLIETHQIYTDQMGNKWWGFRDLFQIPYIRVAFTKTISDLFKVGLSPEDILTWCKKEKEILRAAKNDPEKYEKLYALILEKESQVESTVDPVQQHLALCTIYVLSDDEAIDQYSYPMATKKMDIWKLDPDACNFFLTWHTDRMAVYMKGLNILSEIALNNGLPQMTPE